MALDDDVRRMGQIALLKQLDVEALRLIAFSSETRVLRSGDVLFRKGEPAEGAFLLVRGTVAVQRGEGRPALRLKAPALLGEMALITDGERPVTAAAAEPCTVMRIPRAAFRRALEEFPDGAARLRLLIAQRLAGYARELQDYVEAEGGGEPPESQAAG